MLHNADSHLFLCNLGLSYNLQLELKASFLITFNSHPLFFIFLFWVTWTTSPSIPLIQEELAIPCLFSLDHYGSLRFFTTRNGIQSLQKFAFKLLPFNS